MLEMVEARDAGALVSSVLGIMKMELVRLNNPQEDMKVPIVSDPADLPGCYEGDYTLSRGTHEGESWFRADGKDYKNRG